MDNDLWARVDAYLVDCLVKPDAALAANADANLPSIDVSPTQGKFLHLLVRIAGARRVLEIGTLGGYSTIWMAQALPADGRIVTLEVDRRHADVARGNFERAGLSDRIDLRIGAALDTLPSLEGGAPFDLVFIDADKPNNPYYLDWALKLSRRGTVIIGDNIVRKGAVVDADATDETTAGTRRLLAKMGTEPRLTATALQTVGSKGWDGFAIALVE